MTEADMSEAISAARDRYELARWRLRDCPRSHREHAALQAELTAAFKALSDAAERKYGCKTANT